MGGLKSQKTRTTVITPSIALESISLYKKLIYDWRELREAEICPLQAVGSSAYSMIDFEERNDVAYGDVDYLVSLPFPRDFQGTEWERRKEENRIKAAYESDFAKFVEERKPEIVDIIETLRSSPTMAIMKLPDERYVQVDMVMTFPRYQDWMRARYCPERGLKGYIMGNLYAALGAALTISIGTEGVTAKVRKGKRVSTRCRKNFDLEMISVNPRSFLTDIANYLLEGGTPRNRLLTENPGVNPDAIDLDDLAKGINGLSRTLADAKVIDYADIFLHDLYNDFSNRLDKSIEKKKKFGASKKKLDYLHALNQAVRGRVYLSFL